LFVVEIDFLLFEAEEIWKNTFLKSRVNKFNKHINLSNLNYILAHKNRQFLIYLFIQKYSTRMSFCNF